MSSGLIQYVDKFEIDSKQQWTPSRSVQGKLKFPDHYGILLSLKGIPTKRSEKSFPGKKTIRWNTWKKGGWEDYRLRTENNEKLLSAANINSEDPEIVFKVIEKELNSVKFASFGKVKTYTKSKDQKYLEALQREKMKIDRNSK